MLVIYAELLSVQVQLINDAYNLVIDAMLGPEADCDEIKEPYSGILVTLKQIKTPIVSVDVPSGEPERQQRTMEDAPTEGALAASLSLRGPGPTRPGPGPSLGAHVRRRINLTLCSRSP